MSHSFGVTTESEVSVLTYLGRYESPIGVLSLSSDGESLCKLSFTGQVCSGMEALTMEGEKEIPVFAEVRKWLDIYFSGKEPDFMPKLSLRGSEFQLEVWESLRKIPYGQVITYGDIAKEIAGKRGVEKMSAQAVGGAVGRNPIGILVPCHRVIGKNGSMTGFGGGLWRKEALLKLEGYLK